MKSITENILSNGWCIVYALAFVLPWLIVRALPRPKTPPMPPRSRAEPSELPDVLRTPPSYLSDDLPDYLRDIPSFLRETPDFPRDDVSIDRKGWLSRLLPTTAGQRRRLRMQMNGGYHTRAEWQALCQAFGMQCARCGRRRPLTKDHIVPVSLGLR